ncbi:MAG: SEFIR domain-containing protein [Thiofilum sp.]|uniref:SEFIR domain-containing protein n=1 Tax=Thiofilum sp. TaxID=2212733 RepID=UPI0025E97588|nr:SEFIR domain-containing protein [Thiofilum sp.]MBK8454086.1 TIR domain-containing protein [Thiofilum sp.]
MTTSPKVFISYSHDSSTHRDFVRSIADQLRTDGIDALIDQYLNGSPREGWIKWMEQQIETADFVLLMCTPVYLQRYRGQDLEKGRGVNFEGVVISQTLYDAFQRNDKFIPVIPHDGSLDHVPLPLRAYDCYRLPDDYDNLYRYLTKQPAYIPPPLGSKKVLPPLGNTSSSTLNQNNTSPPPAPNSSSALTSINAERRARLEEKLRALYKSYDLETRVEEKMRLEAIIAETADALKKVT